MHCTMSFQNRVLTCFGVNWKKVFSDSSVAANTSADGRIKSRQRLGVILK